MAFKSLQQLPLNCDLQHITFQESIIINRRQVIGTQCTLQDMMSSHSKRKEIIQVLYVYVTLNFYKTDSSPTFAQALQDRGQNFLKL